MTHDDIIRMARTVRDGGHWNQLDIVNFGLLVAAHEREACAKECETLLPSQRIFDHRYYGAVGDCVATIRARGEA